MQLSSACAWDQIRSQSTRCHIASMLLQCRRHINHSTEWGSDLCRLICGSWILVIFKSQSQGSAYMWIALYGEYTVFMFVSVVLWGPYVAWATWKIQGIWWDWRMVNLLWVWICWCNIFAFNVHVIICVTLLLPFCISPNIKLIMCWFVFLIFLS